MAKMLPGLEDATRINQTLVNDHNLVDEKGDPIDFYKMMVTDRIKLQRKAPFWAIVLQSMLCVEVPYNHPLVKTLATDGARIFYNPLFMFLIGEDARMFVLAHEVCHVIFDTFTRRGERDFRIWNYASDYVINQVLKDAGLTMPDAGKIKAALDKMRAMGVGNMDEIDAFVEKFDLKKPEKVVGLQDDKYKEMTQEQVYEDLTKEAEQKMKQMLQKLGYGGGKPPPGKGGGKGQKSPGKGQGDPGDPGDGDGDPEDGEGEGPGNIDLADALGLGTLDSHIMEELMEDEDFVDAAQRIRSAVEAASAQGRGTVPGAIASLLEANNKSKVNWRSLLQAEAMDRVPEDYSWERPMAALFPMGITLPDMTYEDSLRACLVVDTSGSMSDDDLRKVLTELQAIGRQFTRFYLRVIQCDTNVQEEVYEFTHENLHELATFKFSGRGGTIYLPAMEYVAEHRDEYDWMVFFTDGGGEGWNDHMKPKLPPLVWLIVQNYTTPPGRPTWGQVIMYDKYE